MSKIAIMSDVHANINGLNLFLDDISKRGVNKIFCLGDLVSKYFYPKAVVDIVRDSCSIVIKGNCDYCIVENNIFKFTRKNLGIDGLDYLQNLKNIERININGIEINLFHSNINDLESIYNPLFDNTKIDNFKRVIYDYNELFIGNKPQVSFTGHTHQCYIGIEENNNIKIIKDDEIIINDKQKVIINVGSIGEHNHIKVLENRKFSPIIDPFLSYCILDDDYEQGNIHIKMIKIPYKEELLKVYLDYKDFQIKNDIKNFEEETMKIENSLIKMGYDEKTLKLKRG